MSTASSSSGARVYTYCAHADCRNTFIASSKAWPHIRPLCHVHRSLYEQHVILDAQERAKPRPRGPITNAANPGYLGQ